MSLRKRLKRKRFRWLTFTNDRASLQKRLELKKYSDYKRSGYPEVTRNPIGISAWRKWEALHSGGKYFVWLHQTWSSTYFQKAKWEEEVKKSKKRQGGAGIYMEMHETWRGYLMCIEAREYIFVCCTIITKLYHFTLPCRLIFLTRKSLWLNFGCTLALWSAGIRSIYIF